MALIFPCLAFLARQGRIVLVAGLVVGIALPPLAATLQAYIPEVVAVMLFLAAFRIGPSAAIGRLSGLKTTVSIVILFQVALPCLLALGFRLCGFSGPLANAVVLAAAASPISGSPNLTLMAGHDPAPSLRLLIVGTALLPLTVLPAFFFWPLFGAPSAVVFSSLRLLVIIGSAAGLAFALRHFCKPVLSERDVIAVDGLSAFAMAFAVIGLMAAFGTTMREEPMQLLAPLAAAFLFNFGLQIAAYIFQMKSGIGRNGAAAHAISAGNRNNMLFLAALPATIMAPLYLFIACYQIPMYLTPLLLGRFYRGPADQSSS
ncbi:hypothetical protein FJU08_05225 [Martelella alba]|uniref:BASS family bile acid:Na+ symporter n=1 Tax=Martelella alba TaxID=2590451 RepID=A0A506UD84_9HYPH|nr:hypothetical protein [Martelella alba]TPW32403.1 hypothetical protein FJU08_05225 [Martelella alba]